MNDNLAPPVRGYRFADFRLELAKRRLIGPTGTVIPLSGRAYEVLAHLVENRERVVGKDELIKAVWPHSIVEENNLNQAISVVRRALGDSREQPRFVVTVAGRGYRFIGDAVPLADSAVELREPAVQELPDPIHGGASDSPVSGPPVSDPRPASGKQDRISRRTVLAGLAIAGAAAVGAGSLWKRNRQPSQLPKSIAVLPFRPLLPEASNPAMELGVTELLVNRLSRLPGVVVAPLSSVMRYATSNVDPIEAGRALHVEAVVDGHLYVHEDRLRLTARLLSVDDGAALWASSFTERLGELLAVQDALTLQLVNAITMDLPDETRSGVLAHETKDVEAWQLYANGRYQVERREGASMLLAVEFFDAALKRDPRFALASAGLSDAYALTVIFDVEPPAKGFGQARQAALRAMELDPSLPAAHAALGHVVTQYDRDLEGGRRRYLQALKLKPTFGQAMAFMALNLIQASDVANAAEYIQKAQALEPANFAFLALSGWIRYFARAYDVAEWQLSRLVEAAPKAALPRQFLAHVLLAQRKGTEVVRLLEGRNDPAPSAYSNLGRAYAQTGNVRGARAEIEYLQRRSSQGYGVGFEMGLIQLELGEREHALASLERGMDDHSQLQGYLNVEPALDPLRAEPRFQAISRRLRLG